MSAPEATSESLGTGETSFPVPVGAFGRDAPKLLAKGKIVLPVRVDKQPAVKGYLTMGRRYARELAGNPKFSGFALGIRTGPENNLTVADIDSTDPAVAREAERIFGEPTVIVATASDKRHFYYAHTDEPRLVRPFKDQAFPVDVIGAKGFTVAPSSEFGTRAYRFIKGGIEDLNRLPPIRPSWRDALPADSQSSASVRRCKQAHVPIDGMRNIALFDYLRSLASPRSSLEEMIEAGQRLNAEFAEPLSDAELMRTASSVWTYKQQGRLILPNNPAVVVRLPLLDAFVVSASEPNTTDALLLWLELVRQHSGADRDSFAVCPKAMARDRVIGRWSAARIRKARNRLLEMGRLEVAREGSAVPGNRFEYRLTGETSFPNVTYTSPPSSSLQEGRQNEILNHVHSEICDRGIARGGSIEAQERVIGWSFLSAT